MFRSVHPVCPVTNITRTLEFWVRLGFDLDFVDTSDPETASYCGVRRDGLLIHLQAFTPDQLKMTQTMAIRVELENVEALNALGAEWEPLGVISAPLGDRPWGNREFGLYDPDKTPFFFCVGAG